MILDVLSPINIHYIFAISIQNEELENNSSTEIK